MDWDKLRVFHSAAEAGSFTHAGEVLRMSQSAVSRQVSALEKDLGVPLFHRHARGLVLTEQGEVLFRTASEVLTKLQTAETLLGNSTTKPAGDLRITASTGLGSVWVTQRLREFIELYPDIRIELILNDEPVDLSMRVADVAIWAREPMHNDLIRRPLFAMQIHAYASGQYIRKFGAPQKIQDLDRHRLVSFMGNPPPHLAAINSLETLGRDGRAPRVPAMRASTVLAREVRRQGRHRHRADPRLPDGGGDRAGARLERDRDADAADLFRLSRGIAHGQEGAGFQGFPRHQGPAVEVLSNAIKSARTLKICA